MSAVLPSPATTVPPAVKSMSPNQRAWARFRRNRIGYVSLWCFLVVLVLATFAELVSNDRPLVARYDGQLYFPLFKNHPETTFGGDFGTPTDWSDPLVAEQFAKPGNWAFFTLNRYGPRTSNPFELEPSPAPPSRLHWLGTDSLGQDMVARLLYGFRVSIWFAFALTLVGTAVGIAAGALQGYFGGRVDLVLQRFIEIWGAVPELYLLIIFASIFEPSLLLLLVLLSLWGWMGLSDYVRAEFLRNRSLEFVKAARALGLSNGQIIWRHVLPNSMTPVITFLPFPHERRHRRTDLAGLPGPGRAGHRAVAGRPAAPGQEQPRRLVDHLPHLRRAGADDAGADLHRRRAARRLRHPEIMTPPRSAFGAPPQGGAASGPAKPDPRRPLDGPLLQIDRLSVRFGTSTVVNDVSFTIAAGEKFGLVGESGSGKSITALSVLRLVDAASTSGVDPLRR